MEWLKDWQGLVGSAISAGIAVAALIWAVRQFRTSDRQAAVASAAALRQRLKDRRAELTRLSDAQEGIATISQLGPRLRTAATVDQREDLRQQIEIQRWKLREATQALAERHAVFSDPNCEGFIRTSDDIFALLGLASLMLEDEPGRQQAAPRHPELPRRPADLELPLAALINQSLVFGMDLRRQIQDDIKATLRGVNLFEEKAIRD